MPEYPGRLALRIMEITRTPLMVNAVQFAAFEAAGLDTSNMAIIQPLPIGPAEPLEFVAPPPCDCALCRLGGPWGK